MPTLCHLLALLALHAPPAAAETAPQAPWHWIDTCAAVVAQLTTATDDAPLGPRTPLQQEDGVRTGSPALRYRLQAERLLVSSDDGGHWLAVAASCGPQLEVGVSHVAADAGREGHVVVSWTGDAAGCLTRVCAQRRIAWTGDISAQVAQVQAMAGVPDPTYSIERSGGGASDDDPKGWHYAALGHLATDAPGRKCEVEHAGIQPECRAAPNHVCHATHAMLGAAPERFCPSYTQYDGACTCGYPDKYGIPRTLDESACQFPTVSSLAIDPRSGQVYAASDAGLLFSPDGGRKWRRHGQGAFFDWGRSNAMSATHEPWPYADKPAVLDATTDPGVRILTLQGLPDAASLVPWLLPLDLNAQPELLTQLSPVKFVVTPCAAVEGIPVQFEGRQRVQVTAAFTATWRGPLRTAEVRTSVFVAHGDSCKDEAGRAPLVFWDVLSGVLR